MGKKMDSGDFSEYIEKKSFKIIEELLSIKILEFFIQEFGVKEATGHGDFIVKLAKNLAHECSYSIWEEQEKVLFADELRQKMFEEEVDEIKFNNAWSSYINGDSAGLWRDAEIYYEDADEEEEDE